jgi:outer membrane protein TolC
VRAVDGGEPAGPAGIRDDELLVLRVDRFARQGAAQIAAATRTLTQATRVYELTELRYTEGVATQLDVSDARLALQQARMNEANAYHDFYLALARAERALGVTLIDVR